MGFLFQHQRILFTYSLNEPTHVDFNWYTQMAAYLTKRVPYTSTCYVHQRKRASANSSYF